MNNIKILDRNTGIEGFESFQQDYSQMGLGRKLGAMVFVAGGIINAAAAEVPFEILESPNYNIETRKFVKNYQKKVDKYVALYKNQLLSIATNEGFIKSNFITEILSFKSLNNNWDGYDAIPLEVKAASNAILVLDNLDVEDLKKIKDIYPNPHGTISFSFENNMSEIVYLEIGNKSISYYTDFCNSSKLYFDKLSVNKIEINKLSYFVSKL